MPEIAAGQSRARGCFHIEPERTLAACGIRPVASEASVREDGADLAIELDRRLSAPDHPRYQGHNGDGINHVRHLSAFTAE